MNFPRHIVANITISAPLKYWGGWSWDLIVIFVISAVLIDIDHLAFFSFKYKTVNPKTWLKIGNAMRNKMQPGLYVLHSPEFNLCLGIMSYYNEVILVIFLSNIIHISLDIYEHYKYHKNFKWIKSWSIVYALIN
jgi:hypothetical protein